MSLISSRLRRFSPSTLRNFDAELQLAESLYEKKIPDHILTSVPLAKVDAISIPKGFSFVLGLIHCTLYVVHFDTKLLGKVLSHSI